jgi:hypothetical protein
LLKKTTKKAVTTEVKAVDMNQMKGEIKATMDELLSKHPVVQANDDQMRTLLAEVAALKATIQSLVTQTPISNPSHQFQGYLLTDVDQGEFITDTVDTQGDMVDGTLVILQQHGTNHFLCYMEADDATLPFGHFSFVETTLDAAKQNSRMQFLMKLKGTTITLQSAFFGELVGMQRHRDNRLDGFIATAVEVEDDTTTLQGIHKDGTLRLVGPRRQHLRLVTITNTTGNPYDILASNSILPAPQGCFILHRH